MIPRIGVDLVPLRRVRAMARDCVPSPLIRMLSTEEWAISQCPTGTDIPGVAGRLAAKEAVFKLFRAAEDMVPWRTTEILKGRGGWPEVRLSGRAAELAEQAGIGSIALSITHDGPYAVAVAFAFVSASQPGGGNDGVWRLDENH